MKLRFLCMLLGCFCSLECSYAQDDKKWAVGPDLLSLSNVDIVPKYSLFIRYQLGKNNAIRIRPNYYNVRMQPGIFDIKEQKTYGVRVGYERTKLLYKNSLYLLYGLEYIYFNDHQFSFDYSNPTNQQSLLITDHKESGADIFIGCRYFFIPNLSISTESNFQLSRTNIIKARLGLDEFSYNFVSALLIPITTFNLCFHF